MTDPDDQVRFTVGRMEVFPGSPNTVPGKVFYTIDFRHPDAATVQRLGDLVASTLEAAAGPCAISVRETFTGPPVAFDPLVVDQVAAATKALGYSHHALPSGANHDAKFMARRCPTGMIFIPCLGGVSHNEAESATPADCVAGARVLAETLLALAQS
jgi:N-carbamoyl-L-amino-acid hydrolase